MKWLRAILDFLKSILVFFHSKNEIKKKEIELKNTQEAIRIEKNRQDNDLRDRAEEIVAKIKKGDGDEKDLENIRILIAR